MKYLALLLSLLLLSSCKKEPEIQEHVTCEQGCFTYAGTLMEADTRNPIAGQAMYFFYRYKESLVRINKYIGTATTDGNGFYQFRLDKSGYTWQGGHLVICGYREGHFRSGDTDITDSVWATTQTITDSLDAVQVNDILLYKDAYVRFVHRDTSQTTFQTKYYIGADSFYSSYIYAGMASEYYKVPGNMQVKITSKKSGMQPVQNETITIAPRAYTTHEIFW